MNLGDKINSTLEKPNISKINYISLEPVLISPKVESNIHLNCFEKQFLKRSQQNMFYNFQILKNRKRSLQEFTS